jgi:DnaK suppressor protein
MNKQQLKKFKTLLEEKRDEIVKKAKQTLAEDMALDANDLPDEMDLASSEYLQSFQFRLRGREKVFLEKIDRALGKIAQGDFGTCDECGEEISVKRLEARPETTLCIRCKEDQERTPRGARCCRAWASSRRRRRRSLRLGLRWRRSAWGSRPSRCTARRWRRPRRHGAGRGSSCVPAA